MPGAPPADPISGGLAEYAQRLRRGETFAVATTEAYLARLAALDPWLGAFQHVACDSALATARRLEEMRASGTDLGPLMGVPVAIKDIFAVDGMPTTSGSNLDVADIVGGEGSFVRALRQAGCVVLGLTKTPEFARSGVGLNAIKGTPRNPWDRTVARVPGGSSSGAAVAMAAGLCGFAVGSDTTGSVRVPASFCGVVGLKTTKGLWATDGVFPLSPTLDTIGVLSGSVGDAALVFAALTRRAVPAAPPLSRLRLGIPAPLWDGLDAAVARRAEQALARLEAAGVVLVSVDLPEMAERDTVFKLLVSAELIAGLGRARFLAARAVMDGDVWERTAPGLALDGDRLARIVARHRDLCALAVPRMDGLDGWICPTSPLLPATIDELADGAYGSWYTAMVGRNSWAGSLFGLCGLSLPIGLSDGGLPIGLQILCPAHGEDTVLALGLAIEGLFPPLGAPPVL
jgi:aspartyl-tRNA(Asn)/glutamyl-tRNA(Gln) amidotransferase subunit A